jgi:3-deoxy-D-manno-octulosonate 8-phosphate phosphatase (KDO 8-P phosphatase)
MAKRAGLAVYFITGRTSEAVARRAQELEIDDLYQGVLEKGGLVAELERASGKDRSRMAYMGDDLVDLPPMSMVGLSACPSDAAPEVRERAALIAPFAGGRGSVAWFIEEILKARGDWGTLIERYTAGA